MLLNTPTRYGSAAIILHWVIAALILGQIVAGLVMVRMSDQRLAFDLIQWHKSFGFLILALVVFRIGWRLANIDPHFPDDMPSWERQAAKTSHRLLYLLMLALPVSGWVLVSVSVLGIPTHAFYLVVIPHLPLIPSDGAETLATTVHAWLAYGLTGLIVLHALAALRHHFLLGDSVLKRMLGWKE